MGWGGQVCELAPGFLITPDHPVKLPGASGWSLPAANCTAEARALARVYSLVVAGGFSFAIQGVTVAAEIESATGVPLLDRQEYYDLYQLIASAPGFEQGHVVLPANQQPARGATASQ
jgi:hypothetical protein